MKVKRIHKSWCEAVGHTDQGKVRQQNQDSFCLEAVSDRHLLVAVADGMGGHQGGQAASQLAIERLLSAREQIASLGASALTEAVRAANATIFTAAGEDPGLAGMGTTLTAALICPRQALVSHVGDSRLYHVRADLVRRTTEDDSLVASMVREGQLSGPQAQNHPLRHVLTAALGAQPQVEPHFYRIPLKAGDRLLLCSDGLTTHVEEKELAAQWPAESDLEEVANRLIELANQRGGTDNITVILVRLRQGEVT